MPRFNVKREDGKWACFSTKMNCFITPFMSKDDYEDWRKYEYGMENFIPAEQCNLMPFENCMKIIQKNTKTR